MPKALPVLSLVALAALALAPNACSSSSSTKAVEGAGQGGEADDRGGSSSDTGGKGTQAGSGGKTSGTGGKSITPEGGAPYTGGTTGIGGEREVGGAATGGVDTGGVDTGGADAQGGAAGAEPGIAGAAGEAGSSGAGGANPCDFGEAQSAGTNQQLNLFGEIVYFANGNALPAGHYRIKYVDGCMKYASDQDWTIHAYANGSIAWWFVGDTSNDKIVIPPGTSGYATSNGAYADFEACVAANAQLPAAEFDFAGGKIGVWLADSNYGDNLAGVDNRNPKWNLVRLDCQ